MKIIFGKSILEWLEIVPGETLAKILISKNYFELLDWDKDIKAMKNVCRICGEPNVNGNDRIIFDTSFTEWRHEYCKKEKQMTREDAINKLKDKCMLKDSEAREFINNLQELGLIKFDEPKKETAEEIINEIIKREWLSRGSFAVCEAGQKIIQHLNNAGYKIV